MVHMKFNRFTRWFLLAASLLTFSLALYLGKALAQHIKPPVEAHPPVVTILPDRIVPPPRFPAAQVTLTEYDVDTTIRNNIATTTITQTYRNASERTLEARYLFPLPPDATVSGLTLAVNGKSLEGRVLEKEQARDTYRDIVRRMIDPGLLEYLDDQTVQASVGPFFPGESKQIRLSYTQLLKQDGGLWKYAYRLGSQAHGAYPGEPPHILPFPSPPGGRIPTAKVRPMHAPPDHGPSDRIIRPLPMPDLPPARPELRFRLNLFAEHPLKTIYSPTHNPKISRETPHKAIVTFSVKPGQADLDRNFVLYYSQDQRDIAMNTLDYRADGEDGYFLLALRAPDSLKNAEILPKDIVLALDTSGSMSGVKLAQAKSAIKYIIGRLRPVDRFSLLQFNTDVSSPDTALMPATPERKKDALEYVESLQAEGSTNIEAALRTAFARLNQPDNRPHSDKRPAYVVFLTDGEPTIGVTDVEGLVKIADQTNTQHANLFNFGVGYDLNAVLLDKLADHHHGATTFVEPDADLELAMTAFYRKVEFPVLTDTTLRFEGVTVSRLYPEKPGDLFVGGETLMLGRFSGGNQGAVILSGRTGGETRTFRQPIHWHSGTQHAQLPRLWAGRRIAYLLDAIRQNGENAELRDEVIALSKRYGIITPYTSFLATEPEGVRRPVIGGGGGAIPGMPAPLASPQAMRRESGRDAVQFSKALSAMKHQASAAGLNAAQTAGESGNSVSPAENKVRVAGDKTFIRSPEGVWTDTAYDAQKDGPPVRIPFGTDAYFKLLAEKPVLLPYLSLDPRVLVVWEEKNGIRKAYEITPAP